MLARLIACFASECYHLSCYYRNRRTFQYFLAVLSEQSHAVLQQAVHTSPSLLLHVAASHHFGYQQQVVGCNSADTSTVMAKQTVFRAGFILRALTYHDLVRLAITLLICEGSKATISTMYPLFNRSMATRFCS